jgi:hypothetical protein
MRHFSIFILCLTFVFTAQSQDPNFHIYLCFGQSNMEGQGTIESQDRTVNSRFQFLQTLDCSNLNRTYGSWYTAVPPLVRCFTRLGPADYFGRTMVANMPSNIKIGVVNVSIAGCDIALYGKTGFSGYDTYNAIPAKYNGSAYAWLLEMAKLAQKDGVIKGILLHQGETNNGQADWPLKVKAVYENLLTDLKLNAASTPLLVGETLYANQGGACALHNTIINKVPSTIPNSYVISSADLPGQDAYHFNSAGYRTLGERYAQKMLALLNTNFNKPPSVSFSSPSDGKSYSVGANIQVTATAKDDDGTVSKVAFYNYNTLLSEDNTSPYELNIVNAQEGYYKITAVATDNSANTTTSAPLNLIVGSPSKELISNGEFDNGTNDWLLQNNSGAVGAMTVVDNTMSGSKAIKICPTTPGTADWHIQLYQPGPIEEGKSYELSFLAKADADRSITTAIQQAGSPYTVHFAQGLNLTTSSKAFTYKYEAIATDASALVKFFVGNNNTCVYLDKISFKLNAPVVSSKEINDALEVQVYPNPHDGNFNIKLPGTFTYSLYTLDGKLISKKSAIDHTSVYSGVPSNTLILRVSQDGKELSIPLIKQ